MLITLKKSGWEEEGDEIRTRVEGYMHERMGEMNRKRKLEIEKERFGGMEIPWMEVERSNEWIRR